MTLAIIFLALISITDVYDFRARLKVPQVIDNMTSQGFRAEQLQDLVGHLCVTYEDGERPYLWFSDLTNRSYRVSGRRVGYSATVADTSRWNLIGSNRTGVFRKPSVNLKVTAEPDYIPGGETPDMDNSFIIELSAGGNCRDVFGTGLIIYSLNGKVAGTQGCGCKAYGHTSPTRIAGPFGATDTVDDVAKVDGFWHARFVRREDSQFVSIQNERINENEHERHSL